MWGTVSGPVNANGQAQLSGALHTLRFQEMLPKTRAVDSRGTYIIAKDIPTDWLFGPYVVECRVDWTDNIVDTSSGTPVAREILQSARFYDYFIVTPPNSLQPPSPVYDVHLVSWMNDWR